jgi:4-alpha-glucanotransferase
MPRDTPEAPTRPVPRLDDRASGLLLHPTSLPGPGASGELGSEALRFVDQLAAAGQRWWQTLPVGPPGYGESPYSAQSAFAGNPALISAERLIADGLLPPADRGLGKEAQLRRAFAALAERGAEAAALGQFCEAEAAWLEEFALYRALKRAHGEVQWTLWEPSVRDRDPAALAAARRRHADELAFVKFEQHRFAGDWAALRAHAAARGIGLIGDLPIFVAHDSADVWQHRELFHLDQRGEPTVIAGVPPDYFSATGQRWGNPLYRWKRMQRDGYSWWLARLRATLRRFDVIRLDHFIGFQRYWEVPAHEPTAINGRWLKGPGARFFRRVREELGALPLIAEDLGAVTPAVKRLRDRFKLPGIKILQFAFGTDPNAPDFRPHNYPRRAVAYTGTHDNDTTVGWFHDQAGDGTRSEAQAEKERRATLAYLGADDDREIHWKMIRTLYASVANVVIFPVQDVLGLGSEARMNRPGVPSGNWRWRLREGALTPAMLERLRALAALYERIGP